VEMSVLFPKVNKPPTWDYRPIYYDPKKDEMARKLAALQAKRAAEEQAKAAKDGKEEATKESATSAGSSRPYVPTLHRGSFREAHDAGMSAYRAREARKSKLRVWIAILVLLLFGIYLLGLM
ncbi:MAG: hypothetical protein IKS26_01180, partial [Paludibacteraceae bacterium]|nr:hypothetical protein [Paludibacteraceae bacterium]